MTEEKPLADQNWEEEEVEEDGEACFPLTGFEAKMELGRLVTEAPAWALEREDIGQLLQSGPGRLRFALTGGIAGGKSTLADFF